MLVRTKSSPGGSSRNQGRQFPLECGPDISGSPLSKALTSQRTPHL